MKRMWAMVVLVMLICSVSWVSAGLVASQDLQDPTVLRLEGITPLNANWTADINFMDVDTSYGTKAAYYTSDVSVLRFAMSDSSSLINPSEGMLHFWLNTGTYWVPADSSQTSARCLLGEGGAFWSPNSFSLFREVGGDYSTVKPLIFRIYDESNQYNIDTPIPSSWQANEWHHIGLSWKSGEFMKIYLDGVLVSTLPSCGTPSFSDTQLYLGNVAGSWQGCSASDGAIYALTIYNGVTDEATVMSDAAAGLPVPPTTATPVFSPVGPEIAGETEVTISSATAKAKIYYTTNGDKPKTSGTAYTNPTTVTVSNGTTLMAIAVADDTSYTARQTYKYAAAPAPTFSFGGKYISGITPITVTSSINGAAIYYTTDGTAPTTNGTAYTSPVIVNVDNGTVLKAIALADGYNASSVTSMTYVIPASYNRPATIPLAKATIDGDLTDWTGVTWIPLDVDSEIGTTQADLDADVPEAYYAARWQANKIYVAVKVRDASHHFTDSYTGWNVRDAIEVFLHTDNNGDVNYSAKNTIAQQYQFGFKTDNAGLWATVGSGGTFNLIPWPQIAQVAGKVDGEWLYYEIAMTPYTYFGALITNDLSTSVISQLFAGEVIGLDVDVICNSNGTYVGKKSENNQPQRYCNWASIGLHQLTAQTQIPGDANGDGTVDVGDLGILAANYGLTSGATWAKGDFNNDGKVDVGDLGILAANYGTGTKSGC